MSKDELRRTLTAKDQAGANPVKLNVYSATPFHNAGDVEASGNRAPVVDPGLLNKRFKQQVRIRWCAPG